MLEKEQLVLFVEILKNSMDKKEILREYLENWYDEIVDIEEIEKESEEIFVHNDVDFFILTIEQADSIMDDYVDEEVEKDLDLLLPNMIEFMDIEGYRKSIKKTLAYTSFFGKVVKETEDYLIIEI